MQVSLIITTYNRPDALHLVLQSILHQSRLPDEVIIADDGSGEETRKTIELFRKQCPVQVLHAWQEDLGFRAAQVRNLAASISHGEYLIFIDGDLILHPKFVLSHVMSAKQGQFVQGRRAMLSSAMTQRVLNSGQTAISPFAPGISLRKNAFHIPFLARLFSYHSSDWYRALSANLSLWKQDLLAVNGFNEDFEGWGREDSELSLRLTRHGLQKYEVRFCAVAYHLAHGKDNKLKYAEATMRNQQLLDQVIASGIVRCENGIDKHL